MSISLDALNHDILIYIFTALSIPEILLLRQVSRRLYLVSKEHAVWNIACTNDILRNGIPFPKRPLITFSAKDLERQTLRSYRLGLNWRSPATTLHRVVASPTKCGVIEAIKFLSYHGRTWIVTTCIGIWWTLSIRDCDSLQVVAHWSPEKALVDGIAINTEDESDAAIAVSVHRTGNTTVEILTISDDESGGLKIEPRRTLDTSWKPIALNGDIVVLCDHDSETLILNWKTEEQALLRSPNTWQDKPLHVAFAHGNVFVVRARSVCIFEQPQMAVGGDDVGVMLPRVFKSFGWVDGVSVALGPSTPFFPASSSQPPLTLLVRNKGVDPWRPSEQFQFMALNADFDLDPPRASESYETALVADKPDSAPFSLVTTLSCQHRGTFRCGDIVIGSYGSAVWVQPSDWAAGGLVTDNTFMETLSSTTSSEASHETLVVALFPGLLNQGSSEAHIKVVLENGENDWSCLDYDEARGLIALGSSFGEVTVYRL